MTDWTKTHVSIQWRGLMRWRMAWHVLRGQPLHVSLKIKSNERMMLVDDVRLER